MAQKPKLTVDCKRIATAMSHFQFQFLRGQWWLPNLKFAENSFWFNHQFFSSYLKFMTQACTVSLFENSHWSVKVPLSCNLLCYLFSVLTWRHGDHAGVQNNSQKVFWEFDSIIMQSLSSILPLFCTPTWPSHHVSENQELNSICPEIIFDQNITSVSLSLVLIGKEDNLWNDRDHCSLLLKMGKNKVWVSSGEGLWEDRCVFLSTWALSIS